MTVNAPITPIDYHEESWPRSGGEPVPRLNETESAVKIANKVLDRHHEDPDSDIAVLARQFLRKHEALIFIASHLTSDEGDTDATEDEFGIDASEVVEMAHDNMILRARMCLEMRSDGKQP